MTTGGVWTIDQLHIELFALKKWIYLYDRLSQFSTIMFFAVEITPKILAEWPNTIKISGKQQELCSLPYSLPPLMSACLLGYLFRAAAEDLWWCCLIQTRSKQLFTSGLPMGAISKRQACYTCAYIRSTQWAHIMQKSSQENTDTESLALWLFFQGGGASNLSTECSSFAADKFQLL